MSDLREKAKTELDSMIGEKIIGSGHLFSQNREEPEEEYTVLKWRWSGSVMVNRKTGERNYLTVEFLLKRPGMARAKWTKALGVQPKCSEELEKEKG